MLAALLASAAATAAPAPADQASAACLAALLERLGWRLGSTAAAQPQIAAGAPCERGSLAEAQAHGDLQAALPATWNAAQRQQALRALLDAPATQCGYFLQLGAATTRAVARLQDNPGYRFSALQLGWIGFGLRGAQAQGWERFRSFGRGYRPAGGNAQAIEAFYSGHVRSECGVGRQIAQLATQRELYGDAAFDRAFSADELSIGTFLTLHDTDSILLGAHAGTFFADGKAVKTSQRGRAAFLGAPGYIVHVFERRYLDDINNQAENFVVAAVSAEAAAALRAHGGFAYYDAQNRRIWELAKTLRGPGRERFERLLYARDPALRARLDPTQQAALAQLDALLDDPFYRGFQVYVHPKGVKPIGYHVVRLLDRNPRTPFAVELTLHNLHTTLYQRWRDLQLRDCAQAPAPAPAAAPAP
ncbi:hypothetical protein [Xanthomonas rydalmerensis]|uniref:Secreted protein n=1 Tax=Xanthomonas rydalmerensis TaxID=3046274 RepID=A0ABZ0JV11_9XANT|nr:hypothetical protein [Xanthomonas sp. DM-2023]WOS42888.1 hypothetical protein QN243_04085 [Xanthomonas sp. DM-2023]WOS47074.1 hypothetical protein QN242_04085 [Xanthomonas sp. DM-2023]WOS51253.1 hypothetical protein QN240_04085 [Xanthomonas sp. DM-2023]WOS55435.1 hypothetical protein QN244_04085 [Xanthomonas sp. DM-2023]WOS59617.1 hypothetical protein QN245_04085 [Xanthomonas sp. DM-2023]